MTRRQAIEAERTAAHRPRVRAAAAVPAVVIPVAEPPAGAQPSTIPGSFSEPRRAFSPAALPTPSVLPVRRKRHLPTSSSTVLAAMLLAAGLALTHALPSYAVPENLEGDAVTVYNAEADKVQTLTVTEAKAVTVTHESYEVIAPPPPPPPPTQQITGVSPSSLAAPASGQSAVRWPFASPSPISGGFGPRKSPCNGCSSDHKGVDFNPGNGTQIQAIAGGVVRQVVSSDSGLGVHVVIDHVIDGAKVSSTYAHMQFGSVPLAKGQVVNAGDPVGRVGNTGASTGAHLHLEIAIGGKQIDPYAWLKAFAG